MEQTEATTNLTSEDIEWLRNYEKREIERDKKRTEPLYLYSFYYGILCGCLMTLAFFAVIRISQPKQLAVGEKTLLESLKITQSNEGLTVILNNKNNSYND